MNEGRKARIDRAVSYFDAGNYARARREFRALIVESEEAGRASPFLLLCLGVAHAELGDLVAALDTMAAALEADPFDSRVEEQRRSICERLRSRVLAWSSGDKGTSPGDAYAALTRHGETTVACHLRAAQNHLESGNPADAHRILQGVVLLHPHESEAWSLLRKVGERRSDEHTRQEAEQMLLLLRSRRAVLA